MLANQNLDTLFGELAAAWDAHQHLRRINASLADLANSSTRLYQARIAMWDWRHYHRLG